MYTWTQTNILNPDKTTCTPFIPDPPEYIIQLALQINNTTLPMNINPKILGTALFYQTDIQQTHRQHNNKCTQNNTEKHSHQQSGHKKRINTPIYKAITRPILEYVSTIWSPLTSGTNINKL